MTQKETPYREIPPNYPDLSHVEAENLASEIRNDVREKVVTLLRDLNDRFSIIKDEVNGTQDLRLEYLRDELILLLENLTSDAPDKKVPFAERIIALHHFYYHFIAPYVSATNSFANREGGWRTQIDAEELRYIKPIELTEEAICELERIIPIIEEFRPESNVYRYSKSYTDTVWVASPSRNRLIALNLVKRSKGIVVHIQPVMVWPKVNPIAPLKLNAQKEVADSHAQKLWDMVLSPNSNKKNTDINPAGELVYQISESRFQSIAPVYLSTHSASVPIYNSPFIVPVRDTRWTKTMYGVNEYDALLFINIAENEDGKVHRIVIINDSAMNHRGFEQARLLLHWWAKFLPFILLNYLVVKRLEEKGLGIFASRVFKSELDKKSLGSGSDDKDNS